MDGWQRNRHTQDKQLVGFWIAEGLDPDLRSQSLEMVG